MNLSSEILFIVLNCFKECVPCYKNFIRGRSNFYGNLNNKNLDDKPHYFIEVA